MRRPRRSSNDEAETEKSRAKGVRAIAASLAKAVGMGVATLQKIWKAHGRGAARIAGAPSGSRLTRLSPRSCMPCRALCQPAGARRGALRGRETADPGARPDAARAADKEGLGRDHDPDYKRNGTNTLFAALDLLEGTACGRNIARPRHQEFIRSPTRRAAANGCPRAALADHDLRRQP